MKSVHMKLDVIKSNLTRELALREGPFPVHFLLSDISREPASLC